MPNWVGRYAEQQHMSSLSPDPEDADGPLGFLATRWIPPSAYPCTALLLTLLCIASLVQLQAVLHELSLS